MLGAVLGAAMAAEIAQTPAVVAAQLEGAAAWEGALRAALPAPLRGVALTARGSSDHAAAYGRYLPSPAVGEVATFRPQSGSCSSRATD